MTAARWMRHYTDLSRLFYLLSESKLTLRDPQRWDDKNDSFCLAQYKEKAQLKTVLALCFVQATERYHFWRVYGAGANGVRIKFKKAELISSLLKQEPMLRHGRVTYLTLADIKTHLLKTDYLPFVKHDGFQDEKEYRLVYGSNEKSDLFKHDIPIPLSCIEDIKVNPWLDRDLFNPIEEAIQSVCSSTVNVFQSTLTDNYEWSEYAKRAR